jgi:hypothetical protein
VTDAADECLEYVGKGGARSAPCRSSRLRAISKPLVFMKVTRVIRICYCRLNCLISISNKLFRMQANANMIKLKDKIKITLYLKLSDTTIIVSAVTKIIAIYYFFTVNIYNIAIAKMRIIISSKNYNLNKYYLII